MQVVGVEQRAVDVEQHGGAQVRHRWVLPGAWCPVAGCLGSWCARPRHCVRWCGAVALASVSAGSSPQRRRPEYAPPPAGDFPVLEDRAWLTVLRPSPTRRPDPRPLPRDAEPLAPHVIVLFGATGDLARRKLLPGPAPPARSRRSPRTSGSSAPRWRTSTPSEFRDVRPRGASTSSARARSTTRQWDDLRRAARATCRRAPARRRWRRRSRRPRRSSGADVPPAALPERAAEGRRWRSSRCSREAGPGRARPGSSWRSRSAPTWPARCELNDQAARGLRRGADLPDRPLPRQGGGAEHPRLPLRQRPVRADLEPQLHRPRADRRARDARPRAAGRRSTRRPAPTATWWSPTCSRCWRSWRWSRRPRWSRGRSARRRTRSSARCCRSSRTTWCAASTSATATSDGVSPRLRHRDVHRAARCEIDNWRWAGRAVLPAHRQADGRGRADHLDRVQGAAEDDVPAGLRRRRRRARTT